MSFAAAVAHEVPAGHRLRSHSKHSGQLLRPCPFAIYATFAARAACALLLVDHFLTVTLDVGRGIRLATTATAARDLLETDPPTGIRNTATGNGDAYPASLDRTSRHFKTTGTTSVTPSPVASPPEGLRHCWIHRAVRVADMRLTSAAGAVVGQAEHGTMTVGSEGGIAMSISTENVEMRRSVTRGVARERGIGSATGGKETPVSD